MLRCAGVGVAQDIVHMQIYIGLLCEKRGRNRNGLFGVGGLFAAQVHYMLVHGCV